jgi:hypothetical protein
VEEQDICLRIVNPKGNYLTIKLKGKFMEWFDICLRFKKHTDRKSWAM